VSALSTVSDYADWHALDAALNSNQPPIVAFKQALAQANRYLSETFLAGGWAVDLVKARSAAIDIILQKAWQLYIAPTFKDSEIALLAVGGYGRGELHPHSDIDVLILLGNADSIRHSDQIEAFLLLLWDIGLEIGHSVRTLEQCVEEAEKDVTVATNLLECRLLCGASYFYDQLMETTDAEHIWTGASFFSAKMEEQRLRHQRFGDSSYNLEPNIKENPGGLRDLQTIGWVVKRHFGANELSELVTHHFLTDVEYHSLIEHRDFLWRIRFALHLLAGRREDRLLFDYQRQISQMFGYQDSEFRLAVEIFMKDYYRAVMTLNRLNEELLQHFDEVILHNTDVSEYVKINRRFRVFKGYIETNYDKVFEHYPFALLEIFLILAQRPDIKGVRASTIRLIRHHLHLIDDKFRDDVRSRSLFMEILRQPVGVTHELRRMNRYGVLAAYVPQFGNIVGQMQHDMFHVYTVDEHTLFLIRNLRRLTVKQFRHELPLCSDIISDIPKPELLYLAALFHDIAKGRGGDHSSLGAKDAYQFCRKHGLSKYDCHLVSWLVASHLMMSSTAQKKDVSAPDTITDFAHLVGNQERLNYLFLLTVADIRATNPQLWNSWKATLLTDLYYSTSRALRRGLALPELQKERIEDTHNSAMETLQKLGYSEEAIATIWKDIEEDYFYRFSADEITWHSQAQLESNADDYPIIQIRSHERFGRTELMVISAQSEKIFAAVTESLDRLQLNIIEARIIQLNDSTILETFVILERDGSNIEDQQRIHDIPQRIRDELLKSSDQQSPLPTSVTQRKAIRFPIEPEISFLSDLQNQWTEIELVARDQPGLLAKIGKILLKRKLQIKNAKVATFGARAEDIFYIVDENGLAIKDVSVLHELKIVLEATLR